jgi:hypothetical protein
MGPAAIRRAYERTLGLARARWTTSTEDDTMQSTLCLDCKHYEGVGYCAAFPDGISEVIFTGQFDHRKPFRGDQGIRFKPRNLASVPADR